ncbi:MAG: LysE family translocator [Lacisediminihabitans sp.]
MIPAPNLLAFAIAAFVLIVIPGPSVLFVIGRSLALGRVGGLLSVLGNAVGILTVALAVAFGVGAIIEESVVAFIVIKVAGGCYMVYLGIQAIRHRNRVAEHTIAGVARRGHVRTTVEGFLVGFSNPKAIVFMIAILPQFIDHSFGNIPLQLAVLGLIFISIGLLSDAAWALTAGAARDWFARSPRRIAKLSASGGAMMIGIGVASLFVPGSAD